MSTEKTQTEGTVQTIDPLTAEEKETLQLLENAASGESEKAKIVETLEQGFVFDPSQYIVEDETPAPVTEKVADKIVNTPAPVSTFTKDAPFGRDANGKRIAPYGFSKKGNVKMIAGRPTDGGGYDKEEKRKAKPQPAAPVVPPPVTDEKDLLSKLTPPVTVPPSPAPVTDPQPALAVTPPVEVAPVVNAALIEKYKVHISGAMALVALDFIAPNVFVRIYNFFSPNDMIQDKTQLKLTPDEKKDLVELAEVVVKEVLEKFSPLQQAALYLSLMYGSKITYAEKVPKEKKARERKAATVNGFKKNE